MKKEEKKNLIENLEKSPMFNLSLSSKELFHSNFLYWLWKIDGNQFLKMLGKLCGEEDDLQKINIKEIDVLREYKNFDLCVVKKEGDKVNDILLVLENKVKSIPDKSQLDKYSKELGDCKKILLTLMGDFVNKAKIEKEWKIVCYNDLAEILKDFSANLGENKVFIDEYIKFIDNLHELSLSWYQLNDNFLFDEEEDYKNAFKLRIHDLYGKLRFSKIAVEIEKKLDNEKLLSDDIRVLAEYSRQSPILTVKIDNIIDNTQLIIQVQGNQYRHAIVRENVKDYDKFCAEIEKNKIIQKKWWIGYSTKSKEICKFKSETGWFIYKYKKIESKATVESVIKWIIDDLKILNK